MNNITQKLRTFTITGLLICFTGVSQTSHATIGLPDSPLFLGTSVPPNIFLALDDSGSMDWEISQTDFTTLFQGSNGLPYLTGLNNPSWGWCYTEPVDDQNYGSPGNCQTAPSPTWLTSEGKTDAATEVKLFWNHNFNSTFYNPTVSYDPWIGEDKDGNAYANASTTAARIHPYYPSRGTQNLTVDYSDYSTKIGTVDGFHPARYYTWTDDGDDVIEPSFDSGDTYALVEIKPATATYSTDGGLTDRSSRSDCAAVPVCTYAEEIQNFANWFSYYRKRQYVLQRAVSELIDDSVSYMGLATLHDNNDVGTPIEDMTVQTKKDDLQEKLSQMDSDRSTPLRELLDNVGQYFDDTDGSGAPSALGFTNSSPILTEAEGGECQQNFVVLMTDGEWNGNTPSDIDNQDENTANIYDGGPHADTFDDTLADVAMKYYKNDLSSLADNVPESTYVDSTNGLTYTDDNPAQHLVTYTVGFGLTGTDDVDTPADHDSGTSPPTGGWPEPTDSATKLDDLQHAAFNGRGAFLSASDPTELIDGLNAALGDIDQRTSVSGSAIAINSTVLKTTSRIFQASFNSVDWTGELAAFSLNDDGTINAEVWAATDNLPTPANRDIFTSVSTGGIEFTDSPANAELNTAIGTLTVGGTTYSAADLIQYIRGDQTNELVATDPLREREEILADIVSSSPISIGDQDLGYSNLPGYPDADGVGQEGAKYGAFLADKFELFTDNNDDPQTAVYVGSNGGMLHAFHDSQSVSNDGNELFAYVPSSLHGKLKELADPTYGHKFFVNGGQSVGDVCFASAGSCTWKTILVGTLGEGGRTVFALDVTDPFNFTAGDVLWEYNFDDNRTGTPTSAEMGFIKGAPQIVRLNNGKWGVVFGNGYNSDSDTASIFILDAEDGTEIAVMDTNIGDASNENGMATPLIVDENGDRIADTIYAGDLFGNLFKFDISDASESNWKSVWEGTGQQKGVAEPLFQALDGSGNDAAPQPITTKPTIVINTEAGFNIIFGTGKYIETSDTVVLNPYQIQTMYSIWDDDNDSNSSQVGGRSDLQEQFITDEIDVTVDGEILTVRVVSTTDIDYSVNNSKEGWFMDALEPGLVSPFSGERIIADPITRFGRAIFTTFIPPENPCDLGGTSVLMEVDALTGARLEDSVFDINGDGIIDDKDYVTLADGTKVPVSGIYIPGTLTSPAVISLGDPDQEAKQLSGVDSETTTILESTGGVTVGRQSWRQLK